MRLRPTAADAAAADAVPPRRLAGDQGPKDPSVFGSWSATRWQYASRARPEQVTDVVTGLGGSVTLSLSDGTYVLTWDVPGHGNLSIGGTLALSDARLVLVPQGSDGESVLFHLAGETLALSSETSAWNFDGHGEVPADFVAVLVRL